MIAIVLIIALAVFGALIALLIFLNYRLWLEREAARRALAVEQMAAANLREAVRRGEWDAAKTIVEGWE